MSYKDVTFLLCHRRTGGTALSKVFRDQGFCLFYDPLNAGLFEHNEVPKLTSNSWPSKHPKNFEYFTEFQGFPLSDVPKNLSTMSLKFVYPDSVDGKALKLYFQSLINFGRNSGKPLALKIEQVGIYSFLLAEFSSANFVGLSRDYVSQFNSYVNQDIVYKRKSFILADSNLALNSPTEFPKASFIGKANTDDFSHQQHKEAFTLVRAHANKIIKSHRVAKISVDRQGLITAKIPPATPEKVAKAIDEFLKTKESRRASAFSYVELGHKYREIANSYKAYLNQS
jgi:hypothetical protein